MHNGICPKCGSREVYTNANMPHKSNSYKANAVPIAGNIIFGFRFADLTNYICTRCGYVESYILDAAKLSEVAERCSKVTPNSANSPSTQG